MFAVVDTLESVIQFGLSISKGDNEYTQYIDLWYSENPSEKVSQLTPPGPAARVATRSCLSCTLILIIYVKVMLRLGHNPESKTLMS